MITRRTQFVALFARNLLIVLLVTLLSRPAIASTDPPVSTNPPRTATTDLPDAPTPNLPSTNLPEAPTPREGEPGALQITILDGEGALNNIRQRTAREPIVQVEDQNHKPVAGVIILFSAHAGSGGAGATFNGLSTLSVKTDANGQAVAKTLLPAQWTCRKLHHQRSQPPSGSLTASVVIHQQNIKGGSEQSRNNGQSGRSRTASRVNHHKTSEVDHRRRHRHRRHPHPPPRPQLRNQYFPEAVNGTPHKNLVMFLHSDAHCTQIQIFRRYRRV